MQVIVVSSEDDINIFINYKLLFGAASVASMQHSRRFVLRLNQRMELSAAIINKYEIVRLEQGVWIFPKSIERSLATVPPQQPPSAK